MNGVILDCHTSLYGSFAMTLPTPSLRVSEANAAIHESKIDCHEFATANSRNDNKSVDCHDFLRSLAITVIKEFSLEFRSLNLK